LSNEISPTNYWRLCCQSIFWHQISHHSCQGRVVFLKAAKSAAAETPAVLNDEPTASVDSETAKAAMDTLRTSFKKTKTPSKFVSYHPIQGFKLGRKPEPPIMPHDDFDHPNHQPFCHRAFAAKKAAIVAALEAETEIGQCRRKHRDFTSMLKAIESVKHPFVDKPFCSFDQALDADCVNYELAVSALAAVESADPQPAMSEQDRRRAQFVVDPGSAALAQAIHNKHDDVDDS
jgi:hypothetical protein